VQFLIYLSSVDGKLVSTKMSPCQTPHTRRFNGFNGHFSRSTWVSRLPS